MAKVSWTDEAERWLSDIYEYIAADNPSAAARIVHPPARLGQLPRDPLSASARARLLAAFDQLHS